MKTRILFVDDEPNILEGLRRSLRGYRNEWEMSFANGGAEALKVLEAGPPFHVIVSDMRMPEMDGSILLDEVKLRYPMMVRIILSGQSERERILRAIPSTHTFLSKPCDAARLKEVVDKARSVEEKVSSENVQGMVSRLEKLPSVPSVYIELLHELESGDSSIDEVAKTISRDVAMTAKVLQLTNSAYFGLADRVTDPHQAAMFLGMDTILSLVLSSHVFGAYDKGPHRQDIEALWRHSLACSQAARQIANSQKCGGFVTRNSAVAGTLHDCGKLVFMSGNPEGWARYREAKYETVEEQHETEVSIFGAGHAEVGAHLLALWGLPDSIVQTVALHHRPGELTEDGFSAMHAIHIADALEHEQQSGEKGLRRLDMESLTRMRLDNQLDSWRQLFQTAQAV